MYNGDGGEKESEGERGYERIEINAAKLAPHRWSLVSLRLAEEMSGRSIPPLLIGRES